MTSLMKRFLSRKALALIALGLFTISLTSYGESYADEADFSFSDGEITRYRGSGGAVNIPPTIDGVAVRSIGKEAFEFCDSLTSVSIPDSVTSIGKWAFRYCKSLTSVAIPDSVRSIGAGAFLGCYSLTSVAIPDSVRSIGTGAFLGCSSLSGVNVAGANPNYKDEDGVLFSKDGTVLVQYPAGKTDRYYTIPDGVTSIGEVAFYSCDSLTSVNIGSGVTSIGDQAFYNCDSLTSVNIGSGVTSIGVYAFIYCKSLTSVSIDATTPPSLSYRVFYDHASGRKFYVPEGSVDKYKNHSDWSKYADDILASDGDDSTSAGDKKAKTNITYTDEADFSFSDGEITDYSGPGGVVNIPPTIDGVAVTSIGNETFENCTSLTGVTIPDSVTRIKTSAFEKCNNLRSLTIGNSITRIGESAFLDCDSLTSVTIPDSVTKVGELAFLSCNSLTSVTLGKGVTNIGRYAFNDCSSLTGVTIVATTPPGLGSYVFSDNARGRKFYVPVGMLILTRTTATGILTQMISSLTQTRRT